MDEVEHYVDLSNHNDPTIDWNAAARSGLDGAWIKLTQATDFIDALADDYVAQVKDAMPLGGYHFGDHRYDAHQQARTFFDRAAALNLLDAGDLAPMYDVENWTQANRVNVVWPNRATIAFHVNAWLDEAVRRGVKRALVYGSLSWWLGGLLVPADYDRDDIEVLNWLAVFNGEPGNIGGWSHPRDALHQHTSSGTVDGIDGRVDKNTTLRGRTHADLTIGGNGVSVQDVFDALERMAHPESDEDKRAAENLRQVIVHYELEKAEPEDPADPITTPHNETKWLTANFNRLGKLIEQKLGSGVPVEGDGTISDANAAKVAQFVVQELKKEGN